MPTAGRRLCADCNRPLQALRARRRPPPTRRVFPVGAGRPSAIGLRRPNSFGTHADRRPKALRRLQSASSGAARQASASADAKGFPGRRRPTVGHRPPEAEFIRHACRPPAEGSAPIEIGLFRRCAPGVGPADAKDFPGRRRPTVGRRPPEAEFIRRTCCRLQRCPAPPRGPRGPCAPLAPRGRSAAGSPPSPGAADPRAR